MEIPHDPEQAEDEPCLDCDEQACLDDLQALIRRGTDDLVNPRYKIRGGNHRLHGRFAGYAWGVNLQLERLTNDLDDLEDDVQFQRKSDQQAVIHARIIVHRAVSELRPGANIQPKLFARPISAIAEIGNYLASARQLATDFLHLCVRCGPYQPSSDMKIIIHVDD